MMTSPRREITIADTWCIQRSYGGGQGHRVYLEPPFSRLGCRALVGGEKLVFLRNFEGVKAYQPIIEINQKLVHALDLYYMDERRAYCHLDIRGDIENSITISDDESSDPWQRIRAVTIRRHDLETYMALSGTTLVSKFDFTRFASGRFLSWDGQDAKVVQTRDIHYHCGVIPDHPAMPTGISSFTRT